MNDIFVVWVVTAIPLAFIALLCVYISRPLFMQRWVRIVSQSVAGLLLMMGYVVSKGMSADKHLTDANTEVILVFVALVFVMKFIAMYLIASYAKSVGKSPYWSFVGLLNFILALVSLIGLWKSEKQGSQPKQRKLTREEIISGLRRMVDDPDTPPEKRDLATDRLRMIAKIKP